MRIDFKNVDTTSLDQYQSKAMDGFKKLMEKSGEGNDFLGWIERPVNYDKEEFARIKKAAQKINESSEILVTVGIGGSYLGAKAVDVALDSYFESKRKTKLVYAGHQLSSQYLKELL